MPEVITPESAASNNGWKNVLIAILLSVLLTATSAWVEFSHNVPRQSDVQHLQEAVDKLSESVADLKTQVAVLADRIHEQPAAP